MLLRNTKMAGNIDKYTNGIIFGGVFALVLLLYAKSPGSYISFLNTGLSYLVNLLTSASWYPASLKLSFLDYIFAILAGCIGGYYVDKK